VSEKEWEFRNSSLAYTPDGTETDDWSESWSQLVAAQRVAGVHARYDLHIVQADELQIGIVETVVRQNLSQRKHQTSTLERQLSQ